MFLNFKIVTTNKSNLAKSLRNIPVNKFIFLLEDEHCQNLHTTIQRHSPLHFKDISFFNNICFKGYLLLAVSL